MISILLKSLLCVELSILYSVCVSVPDSNQCPWSFVFWVLRYILPVYISKYFALWYVLYAWIVLAGSYQAGAPYNAYPAGPAMPPGGQGSYIHVYQTAPSVVVIGGCPACRVHLLCSCLSLSLAVHMWQ